ncbi:hypothetical protein [Bacillus atrophaeus]|uniref:Uncharacterized protein n=1 Tax=Bacillus atrophaeus (strain 1942) TaxID=720555 RepID=A0ABM5M2W6_BACA1|nr:hypothetical protein [Bacillus atrophaeus]ADP34577.1 hypothetical protein BATR1942_18300 [Bacillus atrophaeus 1942]EIM11543.1 hypothetical protein UY9_06504 [Bacillus atrophaeus C89]MDL5143614.1 hypothetical protein [Bacillus atrophaeus]MDQ0929949.1 hypothetical protein [Bacillus atrophaeus]MDS9995406.1 hypothetical protein [Bacillus atrophaeus]
MSLRKEIRVDDIIEEKGRTGLSAGPKEEDVNNLDGDSSVEVSFK